jgi:predicted nucleic acid-binding protein
MPERRRVLDTNTLVSRLLMPGGTAARAVDHALAQGVPLVSNDTLAELAHVLSRPRFDRHVSLAVRQHFLVLLGGVSWHRMTRGITPAAAHRAGCAPRRHRP